MPVKDIDAATTFYGKLLNTQGERVTSGRHYFKCGQVLLACLDPIADGDPIELEPNTGFVYLSTDEPLEAVHKRAADAGAILDEQSGEITIQPWGERSFYAHDPWGNPFCIVEAGTEYRGGDFNG